MTSTLHREQAVKLGQGAEEGPPPHGPSLQAPRLGADRTDERTPGHGTWVGRARSADSGAGHAAGRELPDPDPRMLSRQEGAKGLGRRDGQHGQRRGTADKALDQLLPQD